MVSSMGKLRVLVLDDDEDNAALLETALEFFGFEVTTARTCADAKDRLNESPTDALVTDFSLGDGDALELMSSLGSSRPRVAILVTGYGSPEHQERFKAAGFNAHFVKPVDLNQLEVALRQGLEKKTE